MKQAFKTAIAMVIVLAVVAVLIYQSFWTGVLYGYLSAF
jgi:hypothetical protein